MPKFFHCFAKPEISSVKSRQVTPGSPPVWELSTAVGTGQHSIPAAESTGITIVRAHFPKPAKSCTAAARFNRLPLLFPLYIPVVSFFRKLSVFPQLPRLFYRCFLPAQTLSRWKEDTPGNFFRSPFRDSEPSCSLLPHGLPKRPPFFSG